MYDVEFEETADCKQTARLHDMIQSCCTPLAVLLFLKSNKMFFGYFFLDKFFYKIMKINNFRDDLNDNSAIKEPLSIRQCTFL